MPTLTSNADVVACTRWLSHYSLTTDNQGYTGILAQCVKDLNDLRGEFYSAFQTYDLHPPPPLRNNGLHSKFPNLHC